MAGQRFPKWLMDFKGKCERKDVTKQDQNDAILDLMVSSHNHDKEFGDLRREVASGGSHAVRVVTTAQREHQEFVGKMVASGFVALGRFEDRLGQLEEYVRGPWYRRLRKFRPLTAMTCPVPGGELQRVEPSTSGPVVGEKFPLPREIEEVTSRARQGADASPVADAERIAPVIPMTRPDLASDEPPSAES